MNGSVVRAVSGVSRPWRMRQWPSDPTVAHLIFVDHQSVPTTADVDQAVQHARRRGARAIRTSALFPDSTTVVLERRFEPIDILALLHRDITGDLSRLPSVRHRVRPLRSWEHHRAAAVDRDAFGPLWGNDATSLRDIRRATPRHRAAAIRSGRALGGFAISGAAGDNGYLQRVAVSSTHRRQGIARDLVIDSLLWMQQGGQSSALVNTGITNAAALALYEQLGFDQLGDRLTIAELRL